MPEINDAEYRQFIAYQNLGTPADIAKKVGELESDNKTQRDEIRDLKLKLPKETEVVVAKEKADALVEYEKLGKPEELKTLATERDDLKAKDQQRTRSDQVGAAVKAAGWPEDTVPTLLKLLPAESVVELKKEKVKDAKGAEVDVEIPYVTLPGEGQKPQKLADLPTTAPEFKGLKTDREATPPPRTTTYPRQSARGTSADTAPSPEDHRTSVRTRVDYSI